MPNLSGSPRQISYAQDILNRGYDNLGQEARNEERLFSELKNGATRDNPIYQRAQAYRAAQERYAEQVKSLKRLGTMRGSGAEIAALELDGDKIKDDSALEALVNDTYAGLVAKTETRGAQTATPPATTNGGRMTKADIYKKDDHGRYVLSAAERQKALMDNQIT